MGPARRVEPGSPFETEGRREEGGELLEPASLPAGQRASLQGTHGVCTSYRWTKLGGFGQWFLRTQT